MVRKICCNSNSLRIQYVRSQRINLVRSYRKSSISTSSIFLQYFHILILFRCKVTKNINTNICQTYKIWAQAIFFWFSIGLTNIALRVDFA